MVKYGNYFVSGVIYAKFYAFLIIYIVNTTKYRINCV